jgi:hypothetical protein
MPAFLTLISFIRWFLLLHIVHSDVESTSAWVAFQWHMHLWLPVSARNFKYQHADLPFYASGLRKRSRWCSWYVDVGETVISISTMQTHTLFLVLLLYFVTTHCFSLVCFIFP